MGDGGVNLRLVVWAGEFVAIGEGGGEGRAAGFVLVRSATMSNIQLTK